jgi:hypothetical protein
MDVKKSELRQMIREAIGSPMQNQFSLKENHLLQLLFGCSETLWVAIDGLSNDTNAELSNFASDILYDYAPIYNSIKQFKHKIGQQ